MRLWPKMQIALRSQNGQQTDSPGPFTRILCIDILIFVLFPFSPLGMRAESLCITGKP